MAESHCGGVLSSQRCEQSSLLFPEQSESLLLLPRSELRSSLRLYLGSAHRTPEVLQPPGSHRWSSILFSRTLLFRVHAPRSTAAQPSAPVPQKVRAGPCPTTAAKLGIPPNDRARAAPVVHRLNADQYLEDVRKPPAPRAG